MEGLVGVYMIYMSSAYVRHIAYMCSVVYLVTVIMDMSDCDNSILDSRITVVIRSTGTH